LLIKEIRKQLVIFTILSFLSLFLFIEFSPKLKATFYATFINPINTILNTKEIPYGTEDQINNLNLKKDIKEIILDKNKDFVFFTSIYDSHYRTAFKIFESNKFFGIGNKMYRKMCGKPEYYINKFSCTTHPHNFYIQLLAETGLIGFMFILVIFFHMVFILTKEIYARNVKKTYNYSNQSIFIILSIFLNLWPIMPSGNIFNNWLSILIYLPIGFYFYFENYKKINE